MFPRTMGFGLALPLLAVMPFPGNSGAEGEDQDLYRPRRFREHAHGKGGPRLHTERRGSPFSADPLIPSGKPGDPAP